MTEPNQPQRRIDLEPGWLAHIGDEFDKPYMQALREFLREQKRKGKVIYPPTELWFNAFKQTPFDAVRVVIVGQDPYHGEGQAHGLCFSVLPDVQPPPSLKNIFKEIHADLGLPVPQHGYLQHWAEQGVLLINSVLTVEQGQAGAHQGKGWEIFTDRVIDVLNAERENIVFLLWGSYAQKKGQFIDRKRHCVLTAPHPSPLSAHRGFMGCKHFSQANRYLQAHDVPVIDWSLPQ